MEAVSVLICQSAAATDALLKLVNSAHSFKAFVNQKAKHRAATEQERGQAWMTAGC